MSPYGQPRWGLAAGRGVTGFGESLKAWGLTSLTSGFFWLVVAHNLLALSLGCGMARLMKLPVADRRAVTMEVGIQNSGLGLVILFTFFPEAGGMMLITAFWGTWHLVSGLTLSQIWARQSRRAEHAQHLAAQRGAEQSL